VFPHPCPHLPGRLSAFLDALPEDPHSASGVARPRLERGPGVVKKRVGVAEQLVLERLERVSSVVLVVTPGGGAPEKRRMRECKYEGMGCEGLSHQICHRLNNKSGRKVTGCRA